MNAIVSNFTLIITAIVIILLGVFHIKDFLNLSSNEQLIKVKEWLLYAVTMAEKEYGNQTGKIKLRYVYDLFVQKFNWLAEIVDFDTFSSWVDDALTEMKGLIATNKAVNNLITNKNGE